MPRLIALAVLALALSACASTPRTLPLPSENTDGVPAERQLVGRWTMEAVYESGNDVSGVHNPSRNRWIELRADHSFASGGDPYGPNTGVWTYDADSATLEIVSDLGPDDDSVWTVSLRGPEMTWRGVGSARAERFVIVARRAGPPRSP